MEDIADRPGQNAPYNGQGALLAEAARAIRRLRADYDALLIRHETLGKNFSALERDWRGMVGTSRTDATEHLLASPANAARLAESVKQARAGGAPPCVGANPHKPCPSHCPNTPEGCVRR